MDYSSEKGLGGYGILKWVKFSLWFSTKTTIKECSIFLAPLPRLLNDKNQNKKSFSKPYSVAVTYVKLWKLKLLDLNSVIYEGTLRKSLMTSELGWTWRVIINYKWKLWGVVKYQNDFAAFVRTLFVTFFMKWIILGVGYCLKYVSQYTKIIEMDAGLRQIFC